MTQNKNGRGLRARSYFPLAEVRRIDQGSPDRVRTLVAVVTQFQKVDSARAWEMMAEVVKAATSLTEFSGEDGEMTLRVEFKGGGAMANNFNVESFDLTGLFTALAQEDLSRAVELPRSFTGESPRSMAALAVARACSIRNEKQQRVKVAGYDRIPAILDRVAISGADDPKTVTGSIRSFTRDDAGGNPVLPR